MAVSCGFGLLRIEEARKPSAFDSGFILIGYSFEIIRHHIAEILIGMTDLIKRRSLPKVCIARLGGIIAREAICNTLIARGTKQHENRV